ncbi:hypothetical protein Pan216_06110 [Planctomycetes bacterium Pan216]|uniref:Phosphoesterase n=1 Tax=Kolteria novifilia TaxID=2527975 RepID=A0A518AYI6_9BACT|nr:hypothetical protein Pan216_06110 [Planctomycetes bacterium Pan216]
MSEEVLVFPTRLLDELGTFLGFSDRVEEYLPTLLDPEHLSYMPRPLAEDDPSFKQLIPYAVLRSGDQYYCYTRGKAGGEKRLHDLLSLGVGGHVSREDGSEGSEAYEVGFARELDEEVAIESSWTNRIVGMVHDDRTPVGSVHFGIVHLLELDQPKVSHRDPSLAEATFRPAEDIRECLDQLETWARFSFEFLESASLS